MPRRFFTAHPLKSEPLVLAGGEAHHLSHVLRLKAGDEVVLFDGTGEEATAQVVKVSSGQVMLAVKSRRIATTELPFPLILGTAVPKGDRFSWLVEKATELGVTRLIPLRTARSIVDPGSGKLDKMRNTVIAASKQCGRSQLMVIDEPCDWGKFLQKELSEHQGWVADLAGVSPLDREATAPEVSGGTGLVLAVGPEGGLTTEEVAAAAGLGAKLVSLGPRILRTETAALALATLAAAACSARLGLGN